MQGKEVIFITACTAPFPFNFLMDESKNVIRAMHYYSRKIKAKAISKIVFTDSRSRNKKNKQEKYLQKAYVIGTKI